MKPKRKFVIPTGILLFFFLWVFLFSCVGGPGAAVPISPPRNVQIYQFVDGRIDLSWDAPIQHPQQVSWYQVGYSPAEEAHRSTPNSTTTQTRITFTGLDPQRDYQFTITPFSNQGVKGETASKSTMESNGVSIQIQGQILDAYDHLRTISEAYITSVEARSHSDANGAFSLFAAKNAPLIITHNSYLSLFMEVEEWKESLGGTAKPKAGQSFFLTPIQLQREVFPQEEAILSDPQYPEVCATIEEGTFREIVTVSLSSGLMVQASEEDPIPLISFTLWVDPIKNFLKPILVHLAYGESTASVPAHRLPEWAQEAPKMIDFIRSIQKSAGGTDLGFLFVQRPGIEDLWEDAIALVNESTFEATILAHQPGEYMVVPDLSIPAQMVFFQFATQTDVRSESSMKVNVLIDWPVFDTETINLFFGGLLLVNYEFSIFHEGSLVERRILQRSFLGVDGIEPRFRWEKMQNAQTDYILNPSAKKNTGYEFLRNGPDPNDLPDRMVPLADNQAVRAFFTSLQEITLLDQMEPQTPYDIYLRMRISTPLGIITHQIDLGSFTLEGEQVLPPLPSSIVSASSTSESISLQWITYQSPIHTFRAYEIWGRRSVSLDPWERLVHIDHPETTSALIDASILPTIRQNQEYAFFIRTVNTHEMSTDGPIAQVMTKNAPPMPVAVSESQEEGAITSNTLQVQWVGSDEPDFAQYILSWKPADSTDERLESSVSIQIRSRTHYPITHLEADTEYTISLVVEDQGGLRSEPSHIQMRTEAFTPPRTPLIQRIQWNVQQEILEVNIIWEDRSVSEEAYRIFRGHSLIDLESQTEPIAVLPKDSWRYSDTQSLAAGSTYWYKVEAWHSDLFKASAHTSITIPAITDKPSIPTNVQVDPKSTVATITWTASTQTPLYRVWISLNQTAWILKGSQIEETVFFIDGLQPDTPYWVQVVAYNAYGSSQAVQSFRTQPQSIQPPANLQERSLSFDEIIITWDPEQMASGYYIYRQRIGPVADRTATRIGFTQKEEYIDTYIRPDTTYAYQVTAYHPQYGESDKTAALTIHTPPIHSPLFTLTLNRNNNAWGSVTGGGNYEAGQVVAIQATPSPGYRFVNWTKGGVEVSTQANHAYTMPADHVTIVANFEAITYTLTLNRNNNAWGTVTGGGIYAAGHVVAIHAIPSIGYRFVNWTRGGTVVSTQANHNYTMPANHVTLVANFEPSSEAFVCNEVEFKAALNNPSIDTIVICYEGEIILLSAEEYRIDRPLTFKRSSSPSPDHTPRTGFPGYSIIKGDGQLTVGGDTTMEGVVLEMAGFVLEGGDVHTILTFKDVILNTELKVGGNEVVVDGNSLTIWSKDNDLILDSYNSKLTGMNEGVVKGNPSLENSGKVIVGAGALIQFITIESKLVLNGDARIDGVWLNHPGPTYIEAHTLTIVGDLTLNHNDQILTLNTPDSRIIGNGLILNNDTQGHILVNTAGTTMERIEGVTLYVDIDVQNDLAIKGINLAEGSTVFLGNATLMLGSGISINGDLVMDDDNARIDGGNHSINGIGKVVIKKADKVSFVTLDLDAVVNETASVKFHNVTVGFGCTVRVKGTLTIQNFFEGIHQNFSTLLQAGSEGTVELGTNATLKDIKIQQAIEDTMFILLLIEDAEIGEVAFSSLRDGSDNDLVLIVLDNLNLIIDDDKVQGVKGPEGKVHDYNIVNDMPG